MRLFEVEDRFVNDLVMIIRNQIGRSNQKRAVSPLTYPAINSLLRNFGYAELDPDTLKSVYDSNEDLQRVIQDPSQTGEKIILKTDAETVQDPVNTGRGNSVDQMASQGAKKLQPDL